MALTTNLTFDKTTEATEVAAAFPQSINDRTILITGVNRQGIGYATAEAFASQSPRCLILAGRTEGKVKECIHALHSQYPNLDIRLLLIDLSSLGSVKSAASEVLSWTDVPAIDLLINNAGIMRHGEKLGGDIPVTEDGIEQMFATNHLGHFLFTNLIMQKILVSAKRPGSTRIINLSSSGTYVSPFRASDIAWELPANQIPENERPNFVMMKQAGMKVNDDMLYIPTAAYGQSKTCSILFSVGLNRRLFEKYGVLSLALNPGEVKTELGRNTDPAWLAKVIKSREDAGLMFWKSQKQGAATTMVAACDPKLSLPRDDGTGVLLNDCQIWKAPPYAVDEATAEKLWQLSETLTGQHFTP